MNVQLESFVSLLLLVLVSFPYCFADNGHVEAWDQTTSLLSKRASSCAELWLKFNLTQTGNYTLDLGLDQRYSEKENLITVECELNVVTKVDLELPVESLSDWSIESHNEIMTVIHHDSEETKLVQGFESPGSYINDVNYYGTNSISQIEHIIASSFTCQQFIRWECRGSTFSFWYPKTHHNWWVDRHGIGQNYWGNAEPNSNSCGCFPNCYPTVKNSTCNCDANLKTQWLEDSGLLLESKHLPVTQLRFGDTGESYEVGKYTLGPLVCRHGGHRRIFLGNYTAPITITSPYFPERYPPPFRIYEWDIYVSANDLIELVFPEYDIVHYGAYNSVPGCRHALEVDIYIQQSNDSIWKHLISIKREKSAPPYYVTDGRATKFVLRLITCNQVPEIVLNHKGFKGNFRRSKCAGCNLGSLSSQNLSSITSNCFIDSLQCIYIHSTDYPFPHYLYGPFGYNVLHTWNLTTHQGNILQIEFNDFDVNSTPGQNNCDADLLTLHELLMGKLIKKVDYCNINRFNIGKFHSHSNHAMMVLKTKVKKVGNSRGIHATVRSIPETKANIKWVRNAAEGKPTDQSSTRDLFDSSFAVDGNYAQYDASKCSSTNYEREPWWRVNLQKRHRIHGVQIYSLIRKQPEVKATLGTLATISDVNENFFTTINTNDENIQWPMGDYALPMPVSGCPQKDSNYQWLTGMRFHAVQHDKPYDDKIHYWSESIMLKGGATGIGIEQHFCAHTVINNRTIVEEEEKNSSRNMESWMPGKYCIFQYGNVCPEGFHPGSITWFDKSHNNQTTKLNRFNSVHGNVPSGEYTTHNTTINFCCREDGNPETPIRLPKTRPFYLLQYGYICQEVEGMSEVEHSFHYEEEVALSGPSVDFIFTSGQKLKFQDPHPRVDATLFDRGLSLHYCYYDITDKLKGFQVLVDTTPDTFGYGRSYDENSGIARPVNKQFLSAVECASYHVNANEFEQITLNCTQPIEGQYVIIFMKDRKDALQLCEVRVFGEESCGRPLGMATEEVLDSAIAASSFDQTHGLLYHPYNVRLNSPKAWCASNADSDKYIQIDLRLQNSNIVIDSKSIMSDTTTSEERTIGTNFDENHNANYVTIVGVAMQGMQMTFKSYFVTQFQLLFSNDSMHWIFEEEPIGKQKIYKCVQCDAQHIDGNEIVMYNLLKPIVARFIRIKILAFRLGPCMRLDLIGCRGDKRNYCSRELTASTPGVISSPNYPFYYAQFKSCVWKIKPSNHSGHIEIDFIILDLAPAEKSGGKCHDQLLIFHSSQQSAISIESGTGSIQRQYSFRQQQFPKKIISNGPITIGLRTCFRFSMSRYQGFLLRFRETDCPGCGIGDARCSQIHNCTSLCGRILSINYPLNYINSHRCQWLIRAPPGHYFNVTIEDFDIADTITFTGARKRSQSMYDSSHGQTRSKRGCIYDHLSFTDASNGMLLGRFCNSHKPPKYILSNWNELLIEFNTDSTVTARGFKLKYTAQRYQLLPEAAPLMEAPQSQACPFGWLYFRGYCYSAFVETESLQWYQAEEKCSQKRKGRDGHLVSITDYLEMNVVHYWIIEEWKMLPFRWIYIGLIDTNREGFYNWSDGNPMSYTDWYRSNPYQTISSPTRNAVSNFSDGIQKESAQTNMFLLHANGHFGLHNQPDGGAFEDCTVIHFYSIHSTANWHDIPCSLGKKVIPMKATTSYQILGNNSNSRRSTFANSDGLIRSYICKMDSNSSLHQHSPRRPLFTKLISEEEKQALKTKVDRNRYFVCNNFEVISNLFRCDGTPNCRDGSDETEGCPITDICLDSQFKCDNSHCIAIGKYCDFVDDCGDGSDEINCVRRQCKKHEFKCNNDQCISNTLRCDLLPHCSDQSDEGVSCTGGKCNLNTTFQCYYGTCIPISTLCDNHLDCPGKFYEDEHESICSAISEMDGVSHFDSNNVINTFDLFRVPSSLTNRAKRMYLEEEHRDDENEDDESNISSYIHKLKQTRLRKARNISSITAENSQKICSKNRIRTCQDLLFYHHIKTDGYYELQPSVHTKLTMIAYCRVLNDTHAMTILNHDTEDRLYVRSSSDGPGSFIRTITYQSSINLIVALIDHSAYCRQMLSFECSGSGFYFNTSKPNSWWISREGLREYNWGGVAKNSCACYPNCTLPELRCNCDIGLRFNWTRDFGYVEDRSKLPIRQVAFGDVSRIGQLGYVQVGELQCIGNLATQNNCEEQNMKKATLIQQQQFQCNSGQIIDRKSVCIYEFDQLGYQIGCRDVSHLRDCSTFECPPDYVKCPDSYCISPRFICNGKWDCVGGYDEIGCSRYTCPGRYKCANESSCLYLSQLCDGFRQCPLGDDELFCDLTCPESCVCTGLFVNCLNSNITKLEFGRISRETRKLDLSGNNLGPDLISIDFSPFADLGELILQNNNLKVIRSRKFIQLTNLYKLDLRFNQIKVIEAGAFAGLRQVTTLMLENNPQLTEIHSGAFVGLISLRKLNISNTRLTRVERNLFLQMSSLQTLLLTNNRIDTIEKGAFNDLISLVTLDFRGNSVIYSAKDMFIHLKSLRFLSTDSFKFCCLAQGIVPFNRCYPPRDEISDCQDLMSNTVQRLILWVLGIIAFFGNLLVVIWRFKTRRQTSRVSSTLILSLGCSDFLMGIYLLIIASVDEYYRGRYIENSDYWKMSALCNLCGFLSTISSEMSVATLVFITIDRLISISFSFSSYRFTLKFTYRLLFITWIAMFFLSALPLLPIDYFSGQFYSRSGVCLALHITTHRSPGWEYSVAIFLFLNLFAFLIIAFCYVYMYKTITTSTKKMKNMVTQKQDRETRIGRQMLFIVVSNFLCWFPVIIMGIIALAGVTVPGEAYSWIAVFVLPLNSATDPLIYTLVQFIQNFIANRQQDRQLLLATGGSRRGNFFAMHSSQVNSNNKLIHGIRKMSNELSNHIMVAESSIGNASSTGFTANGNLLLRSNSFQKAHTVLMQPPEGYLSLANFMRTKVDITPRDLLEICHSISFNLKMLHDAGFALGTISFDNIFVSERPLSVNVNHSQQEMGSSGNNSDRPGASVNTNDDNDEEREQVERHYRLQTYIPAVGFAYKVSPNDEDADDFAVNMEEFGLVVKRMLQHYHVRQLKSSIESSPNNSKDARKSAQHEQSKSQNEKASNQ